MENSAPSPSKSAQGEPGTAGRSALRQSAQWWEPRRVLYNLVLTAVFVALTVRTWPRLEPGLTLQAVFPLMVLALLANVFYCAGYAVDAPLQLLHSPRARFRWRWSLWLTGTLVVVLLETYWFLDEILPPIQ